jgi:hypothetical protein
LLRTQDRPRSAEPDPSYEICRVEMIVLDGVCRDEGSRSAQASFTVNRKSSRFFLGDTHELCQDVLGRTGAVREVQIVVPDSPLLELVAVVGLIVETNDCRYSHLLEYRYVVFGREVGALNIE